MAAQSVLSLLERASEEHSREVSDLHAQIEKLKGQLDEANAKLKTSSNAQPSMLAPVAPTPPSAEKEEVNVTVPAADAEAAEKAKPALQKRGSSEDNTLMLSDEPTDAASKFRKVFEHYIDITATVVVMMHIVFLIIQMQYGGQVIAEEAGLSDTSVKSDTYTTTLTVFDHLFNAFFVIEMGVRIAFLRRMFFLSIKNKVQWFNLLELGLVVATSVDLYAGGVLNFNFNSFRPIVRFIRLLRMLRVLKLVRFFFKLRILVMTVAASFMALFWSIVLLVVTMLISALFLNQSLVDQMNSEELSLDRRLWIYKMYGTSIRAFWTVFELTFSGGWPNYARPLVEEVNPLWGFFFFVYIIAVIFAMFRIITALFLRDTLALAANDAETAIQEKTQQKAAIAKKLRDFFEMADTSDDGMLSLEEFEEMLLNPKVRTWLSLLELDVNGAKDVFVLLEDDDNCVAVDDFVAGMMRIKGQAKAKEVYNILIQQRQVLEKVSHMKDRIDSIDRSMRAGPMNHEV